MNHFKKAFVLMFSFMFVFSNIVIANPIADDYGDSFETATEVTLPLTNLAGMIDSATDKDYFKFVAPETGYFEATVQSAMASTALYDINGNWINTYTTQLQAGSTYYYELKSYDSRVGSYILSLTIIKPDDYGNGFDKATEINLPVTQLTGKIDSAIDKDFFVFVAPETGYFQATIQSDAVSPCLYNENRAIINTRTTQLQAGSTYYYELRSYDSRTGDYLLSLSILVPSDYGDSFETATEISLPVTQLAGKIDSATDKDCFIFVAPETGYFEATVQSAMASTRLYDINGNQIDTYTTQLQAGSTYYYELTSYDSRVGSYVLSLAIIRPDDHGNRFDQATEIALPTTQSGHIETPIDKDYFKFVAPETGYLQVNIESHEVSTCLYNENLAIINPDTTLLQAGSTYYYELTSKDSLPGGHYILSLSIVRLDGPENNFETATEITLPVAQTGHIESPTDKDYYKFIAQESGSLAIGINSASANAYLYNADKSKIDLPRPQVIAGSTYYIVIEDTNLLSEPYLFDAYIEVPLYGDINEDYRVDSIDYALMKEVLLDDVHFPRELNQDAVDLNGDGAVDAIDFQLLHRFLLNKLDVFPRDTNADGCIND